MIDGDLQYDETQLPIMLTAPLRGDKLWMKIVASFRRSGTIIAIICCAGWDFAPGQRDRETGARICARLT